MYAISKVSLALVVGVVLGWAVTSAAHGKDDFFQGTVRGRSYVHSYKMPFDIGVDREFKPGERVDEQRTRVHIPQHYGVLTDIMPTGSTPDVGVVLWFKDADGVLRNAVLPGVTKELLHIEMVPTRSIDVDYR